MEGEKGNLKLTTVEGRDAKKRLIFRYLKIL